MGLAGKKILVTGSAGMLAADLIPELKAARAEPILTDIREGEICGVQTKRLDICDADAVASALNATRADWIVNCAAYTAVDKAETEYDSAFRINASGVGVLARAASERRVPMLHLSTDYVFGGSGPGPIPTKPLTEESPLRPCGIYGHSKRYGEDLLRTILPDSHLLVRTSWLHGVHGPNFIDTMLRLANEKSSLKVVNDQYGSPTWTGWLAHTLVKLLAREARGVFHAASHGGITWFDFAREIFRQAGKKMEVLPQTTTELNRPAPRPPYSVMDVRKLESLLGETCISWQDCVARHLAARQEVHG